MFKYVQVLRRVFPASLSVVAPSRAPAITHAASVSLGLPLAEGGASLSQLSESWASLSGLLAVVLFPKLMTPPTPANIHKSLLQGVITVIGGA